MKKLAMLLPTNKPKVFHEIIERSLQNIISTKDEMLFAINFQPPWEQEDITKTVDYIKSLGFEVIYSFNSYESTDNLRIPFNKIRHDCARQIPYEVKYYGLCDDDFFFEDESGQMILNIIEEFENDSVLGLVQCHKTPAIIPLMGIDIDPRVHVFSTDCGLFFRKIDDFTVFPEDALTCIGAGEEAIIGLSIVSLGYKAKLRTRSKISHIVNHNNQRNNDWGKEEISCSAKGVRTYIRKKYGTYLNEIGGKL